MRVLLVEDNPSLCSWLSRALRKDGYTVDTTGDGEAAAGLLAREAFDAVILDLGLPRLSGQEVLRRVRARGNDVPILVLTADGALQARIAGLNAGADDYLSKPFDVGELEARLRAVVRRKSGRPVPELACGTLSFDTNTREFTAAGQPLKLTPRERAVLEVLMLNMGRTVSKAALADSIFSLGEDTAPSTIEIYVSRLRKKIAGADAGIFTLRGLGYLLKPVTGAAEGPAA